MRKLRLSIFVALFSAATLNAQAPTAINAKLGIRSGLVEVQRGNVWLPVNAGERINPGERIRTGKGSSAALEMGPGKLVTLTELSQVLIGQSNGTPIVELESGSMKVFASSNIQVAAKDTRLESASDRPMDLELGYQADRLNLTVFDGAVKNGPVIIRGNEDPNTRTRPPYGPDSSRRPDNVVANPTYYVYPYFLYGRPDPNDGKIVPPTVNNPTNPGYRPTQIVPPMSDPIRVPVTKP